MLLLLGGAKKGLNLRVWAKTNTKAFPSFFWRNLLESQEEKKSRLQKTRLPRLHRPSKKTSALKKPNLRLGRSPHHLLGRGLLRRGFAQGPAPLAQLGQQLPGRELRGLKETAKPPGFRFLNLGSPRNMGPRLKLRELSLLQLGPLKPFKPPGCFFAEKPGVGGAGVWPPSWPRAFTGVSGLDASAASAASGSCSGTRTSRAPNLR